MDRKKSAGKNGERHQKEPCLFDWQPWLWWCHMAIEAASHILYERVALAELTFRRLCKYFL
jgi:hypothetical protein